MRIAEYRANLVLKVEKQGLSFASYDKCQSFVEARVSMLDFVPQCNEEL